jgi:hypothetical protein
VEGEISTSGTQPYRAEITNQITPEIPTLVVALGAASESSPRLLCRIARRFIAMRWRGGGPPGGRDFKGVDFLGTALAHLAWDCLWESLPLPLSWHRLPYE